MKPQFLAGPLETFWVQCFNEFQISYVTMEALLPFTATYLCESSFSTMTAMKTKSMSRLRITDDMRVTFQEYTPALITLLLAVNSKYPTN